MVAVMAAPAANENGIRTVSQSQAADHRSQPKFRQKSFWRPLKITNPKLLSAAEQFGVLSHRERRI
jgi:hypothetical protein